MEENVRWQLRDVAIWTQVADLSVYRHIDILASLTNTHIFFSITDTTMEMVACLLLLMQSSD